MDYVSARLWEFHGINSPPTDGPWAASQSARDTRPQFLQRSQLGNTHIQFYL